ncbi:PREDICTED: major royal jelly protein 1-like [Cyphomyrmex costatus]|uniref:major royal jelly protein 1-like n=1 Tax=Cyphomyrmex costatus TaxID=456900 RepID=UPI0008523A0D|nr:PREDICTED: major royal jelly protein 1-like [Cyphomyrmex costatus]
MVLKCSKTNSRRKIRGAGKSGLNSIEDHHGRVFMSIPKIGGPGTPVSLTIVTNETGSGGPLLRPYPDWSWYNNNSMCNGIINVYKLHIECNHIFVMDNGQSRETEQICDPKLLIFDLKNDMLVKTIYIPPHIANNKTGFGLLMDPLVYVPNKECTRFLDEMIVFVADTVGFGLVVYDSSTERMCRVESDYMKPTDANFVINDQNVTYVRGIFSLTIISNELYYAPIAGNEIYKIKIKTLLECPNREKANKQTKLVKELSSQTIDISSTKHYIFYSDSRTNSLVGTNSCTKSNNNTVILAQDDEKLQVISSIEIISYWNQLIGHSNRFQKYATDTYNLSDINFHYFEMDLAAILQEMN